MRAELYIGRSVFYFEDEKQQKKGMYGRLNYGPVIMGRKVISFLQLPLTFLIAN